MEFNVATNRFIFDWITDIIDVVRFEYQPLWYLDYSRRTFRYLITVNVNNRRKLCRRQLIINTLSGVKSEFEIKLFR